MFNDDEEMQNQYWVIQAKTKDDIIRLLNETDKINKIIEKKECVELILQYKDIKKEEIDNIIYSDLVMIPFYYHTEMVHDKALHLFDPYDMAFDLMKLMKKELHINPYHIKHAIEQLMKHVYEKSYNESIDDSFWGSVLHQTMVKQLLFEYYYGWYHTDDDFCENGSLRTMLTLLGEWIKPHRLKSFMTLKYETAKLIFLKSM